MDRDGLRARDSVAGWDLGSIHDEGAADGITIELTAAAGETKILETKTRSESKKGKGASPPAPGGYQDQGRETKSSSPGMQGARGGRGRDTDCRDENEKVPRGFEKA